MTDIKSFAESGADLELQAIRKQYPGFTAVEHLDLKIPAGSFFALLGPSGCGKTTTLRLIAGLDEPTSGSILIGGNDVTALKPHKRPVNTVFQSYALFPHMTILENVAFGLRRRKIADPLKLAHQALQLVELDHVSDRKPTQLSGGQQQRVALARAIVNRPALLLLDEPLGALDLKLRRQMQHELKEIKQEVGLTFLHVTHDQEEAMTMADTVAVMNRGRIEQMGAPQELYDLPKTVFVANFLGQSNLFTGMSAGGTDKTVELRVGQDSVRVLRERCARVDGEVTMGVRPEKLQLHLENPELGSDHNVLGPGTVEDVSYIGVSTQYTVKLPGHGAIEVFTQNLAAGPLAKTGQKVWVSWLVQHGFGLSDIPGTDSEEPELDVSTRAIAAQAKK